MNLLPNNLTFAVLVTDGGWRTDLTIRYCEYFSHKLNPDNFIQRIIFPKSVDDAIAACETDYLLIQSGGSVVFSSELFSALDRCVADNVESVVGNILIREDYATLDTDCLFINIPLWKSIGSPGYINNRKEGPLFSFTGDKFQPDTISSGEERVFVPGACGHLGAGMLIRQLEQFGKATSLKSIVGQNQNHVLDVTSPYAEIRSETIFEKQFLKNTRSWVFSEYDEILGLEDAASNYLLAPAQGLKPYILAQHLHAKEITIYDNNLFALELQRMIFSVTEPTLYGDIIASFLESFPMAKMVDNFQKDEYIVIKPLNGVTIDFKEVDAFSFEMIDAIKAMPHDETATFDFSDIYVYPHNYYRRPLYQVQGLFAEIYSLIKSRTAPTHIIGFAPGYQNMENIQINTSTLQYSMDPTIDPNEEKDESVEDVQDEILEDEVIENVEEPVEVKPVPVLFAPTTTAAVVEDKPRWSPPISPELVAPPPPPSPINPALEAGYTKQIKHEMINGEERMVTVLTKEQRFEEEDFSALFEYVIDEISGLWSFKISKLNSEKKMEFNNGLTLETFLKHLATPVKVNPKTASKFFR